MKVVIFAGGVGTRMWPMSRKDYPKQFQPLLGKTSFFKHAYNRVRKGFSPRDIFVSTGAEYEHFVKKQAPQIPAENIIAEPERRDSFAAVGYATAYVDHYYPNTLMAAVWGADHLVEDEEAFLKALRAAGKVSSEKKVITKIDSRPAFPSIYNGWVEIGKRMMTVDGMEVFEFVRFIEKPDLQTAKRLFRSFKFLINVGYMVWRTDVMLDFYKKISPATHASLVLIKNSLDTKEREKVIKAQYAKIKKDSVDYGIFEKLDPKDMLVIPTDMGWTDVGTWELLTTGLAENAVDNVIQADLEAMDTKGSLIYAPKKKLVATIGVENLVVVDTKDSLLVSSKERSADVKKLLEIMKKKGRENLL